jgi:hypothetical protein
MMTAQDFLGAVQWMGITALFILAVGGAFLIIAWISTKLLP